MTKNKIIMISTIIKIGIAISKNDAQIKPSASMFFLQRFDYK